MIYSIERAETSTHTRSLSEDVVLKIVGADDDRGVEITESFGYRWAVGACEMKTLQIRFPCDIFSVRSLDSYETGSINIGMMVI